MIKLPIVGDKFETRHKYRNPDDDRRCEIFFVQHSGYLLNLLVQKFKPVVI